LATSPVPFWRVFQPFVFLWGCFPFCLRCCRAAHHFCVSRVVEGPLPLAALVPFLSFDIFFVPKKSTLPNPFSFWTFVRRPFGSHALCRSCYPPEFFGCALNSHVGFLSPWWLGESSLAFALTLFLPPWTVAVALVKFAPQTLFTPGSGMGFRRSLFLSWILRQGSDNSPNVCLFLLLGRLFLSGLADFHFASFFWKLACCPRWRIAVLQAPPEGDLPRLLDMGPFLSCAWPRMVVLCGFLSFF